MRKTNFLVIYAIGVLFALLLGSVAHAATTSAPTASPTVSAATQSSSLSWSAPTTREDGTPLAATDIAQYNVYYAVDGPVTTGSTKTVVTGATTKTVTLSLTPRAVPYTINFAVTAVDTTGAESPLSNVVSKTFTVVSTAAPSAPTSVTFSISRGSGCTITPK